MVTRSVPDQDQAWGPEFRELVARKNELTDDATGTVPPERLGTGTRDGTKFLRDDGSWQVTAGGGGGGGGIVAAPARRYARGVNVAGGEFAHTSATLPGVYDTDYSFESAAGLAGIGARGHNLIRITGRQERLQPTRLGALDATNLARVQTMIGSGRAAGFDTFVLDLAHNYCDWIESTANGGATRILDTTPYPVSHLVDFWVKVSTEFKDTVGVEYDLMNEPKGLGSVAGSFTGTVRYDWNDGVQGWTGDSATASVVSQRLRLAATATAGFFLFRKDDAGTKRGGAVTGNVVETEMTLAAGTAGAWRGYPQWQNTSFQYQSPTSVTYTRIDTGAAATGLVAGVTVRVRATFSGTVPTNPNAWALQFESDNATAGAVSVDVDNLTQGTVVGAKTAAKRWEEITAQVYNAIRANGDTNPVRVPLYDFSSAVRCQNNHPDGPWLEGVIWQAHYYPDSDQSGQFAASYATENAAAIGAGNASLAARAVSQLSNFTTWLGSEKGYIGETGWPNTGDTAGWNSVGEAIYDHCDQHNLDVTYWAAGSRWGNTYPLSVYTGANQDVIKSQAAIIEAHPSKSVDVGELSTRVDALGERVTTLEGSGVGGGTGGGSVGPQGSPGLVWRGTWSGGTTYATNDVAYYLGSAFVATAGVTGTAPGAPANPNAPWQILSSAGAPATSGSAVSPSWNGFLGWTFDPTLIASTLQVTAGVIYLGRLFIGAGTVTNLHVQVASALVSPTSSSNSMALVDDAGTRVALTADQGTTWGTTGVKTAPLSTPYVNLTDGFFSVAVLANAATLPTFQRISAAGQINNGCPAGKYRSAIYGAQQASIPSSIPVSSSSPTNNALWMAVS